MQKAEDAERILKTLFEDIQLYWAAGSPADEKSPSWAELEASQTYDIEWEKSMDWLSESIDKHLLRFEQYVFVMTTFETHQRYDTMEALMGKLADATYVERSEWSPDTLILTEVKCATSSEQSASQIAAEIRQYFTPDTIEGSIPPWEIFSPSFFPFYFPSDLIRRSYDIEPNRDVVLKAIDALYHYQKAVREKYRVVIAESDAIRALMPLRNQGYTFLVSLDTDVLPKIALEVAHFANTSAFGGKIETEGSTIHIPEIAFFKPAHGIPALVEYLKSKGCTDITYTLKTVPYASKPEYI
ncbi:MAG: hypothetical protein ABI690_15530 [Chloroflexota bacterium]